MWCPYYPHKQYDTFKCPCIHPSGHRDDSSMMHQIRDVLTYPLTLLLCATDSYNVCILHSAKVNVYASQPHKCQVGSLLFFEIQALHSISNVVVNIVIFILSMHIQTQRDYLVPMNVVVVKCFPISYTYGRLGDLISQAAAGSHLSVTHEAFHRVAQVGCISSALKLIFFDLGIDSKDISLPVGTEFSVLLVSVSYLLWKILVELIYIQLSVNCV